MNPTPQASSRDQAPVAWKLYVLAGVWTSVVGWGLSAVHGLGAKGYLAALAATIVAMAVLRWPQPVRPWGNLLAWPRWRARFRRVLPLLFLVLGLIATLGGLVHLPANYDGCWYRLPRTLHWLAEGQWHWIHTDMQRVNCFASGTEWLAAPFLCLLKSERAVVLASVAAYFLLPGLTFSTLTRLGVNRRVAWAWMWLLPGAWVYAMQTGSLANDSFTVLYALAAVDFALRARTSGRATDWWWGMLAAAALSNTKQAYWPAALPWLVAALPSWRLPLRFPFKTGVLLVIAVLASGLPNTFLNLHYTGSWAGWVGTKNFVPEHVLVGLLCNATFLLANTVVPPFFPWSGPWDRAMTALQESDFGHQYLQGFERFGYIPRVMTEHHAGLGVALFLLLLAGWWAARRGGTSPGRPALWQRCVLWSAWPALAVILAKNGSAPVARYLAPLLPLLVGSLVLHPGQRRVVRRRWWLVWAVASMILSLGLVYTSRLRPLWPTLPILNQLRALARSQPMVTAFCRGYDFVDTWQRPLKPLVDQLPAGVETVGWAADAIGELDFWRPLGSRRVRHVRITDQRLEVLARGVRYLVVNDRALLYGSQPSAQAYADGLSGRVVATHGVKLGAESAVDNYYLIDLGADGLAGR